MNEVTVYATFNMREVSHDSLDRILAQTGDRLACVFCWGEQCFNCDIAKKAMLSRPEAIHALDLVWLHANVYAVPELGTHFGLHGIPVFMFFHKGKKLGRATGWHGYAQFQAAVDNARRKASGHSLSG